MNDTDARIAQLSEEFDELYDYVYLQVRNLEARVEELTDRVNSLSATEDEG